MKFSKIKRIVTPLIASLGLTLNASSEVNFPDTPYKGIFSLERNGERVDLTDEDGKTFTPYRAGSWKSPLSIPAKHTVECKIIDYSDLFRAKSKDSKLPDLSISASPPVSTSVNYMHTLPLSEIESARLRSVNNSLESITHTDQILSKNTSTNISLETQTKDYNLHVAKGLSILGGLSVALLSLGLGLFRKETGKPDATTLSQAALIASLLTTHRSPSLPYSSPFTDRPKDQLSYFSKPPISKSDEDLKKPEQLEKGVYHVPEEYRDRPKNTRVIEEIVQVPTYRVSESNITDLNYPRGYCSQFNNKKIAPNVVRTVQYHSGERDLQARFGTNEFFLTTNKQGREILAYKDGKYLRSTEGFGTCFASKKNARKITLKQAHNYIFS